MLTMVPLAATQFTVQGTEFKVTFKSAAATIGVAVSITSKMCCLVDKVKESGSGALGAVCNGKSAERRGLRSELASEEEASSGELHDGGAGTPR
jgi:hypothetical protein